MKYFLLTILSVLAMSCDPKNPDHKEIIIYKVHYRPNSRIIDTLRVSQNDSKIFTKKEVLTRHPEKTPEPQTVYQLKEPLDGVFYYIHDSEGRLVMAGRYDAHYIYGSVRNDEGNFYNVRYYSYRKNGKLKTIHYMEDGRNLKTQTYDRKGQLDEVLYRDKKSGNTTKLEIYENGEVKKTRVYKSFDQYYTVPGRWP